MKFGGTNAQKTLEYSLYASVFIGLLVITLSSLKLYRK